MDDPKSSLVWAECDRIGITAVQAKLAGILGMPERQVLVAWLDDTLRKERLASESAQLRLTERSVKAAEDSAGAALESAQTSGTSARAAMFAAFVSLLALIVAIAAFFKQS
ncbi:hypothetical protein [Burkholderia sp. LMU1-1-1.1]|uniref:hypothetical protein n=1 Tax=Burkholderia sp. LMU1-1-1.1 TaxID=3135266 RepID=UPI0034297202